MKLYIVLSGIDGFNIRGTAVNSVVVLALSTVDAVKKVTGIVDETDHKYIWTAILLEKYVQQFK